MNNPDALYLINGEFGDSIPVSDRGLHYGDGLFETLSVRDGRPRYWDEHLQRLQTGCQKLHFPAADINQLLADVERLLKTADNPNAIVKILLTRGTGKRSYRPPQPANITRIVALYPMPEYPETFYSEGVQVRICQTRLACNPALAGVKHLNRLEHIIAHTEWEDDQIVEGLMMDSQGLVIEGTMSNVFISKNGTLLTPDLSQCGVQGVMRSQVIKLAGELRIPLSITDINLAELLAADEVFTTNSVQGVWPVRQIDEHIFQPGPICRQIMEAIKNE